MDERQQLYSKFLEASRPAQNPPETPGNPESVATHPAVSSSTPLGQKRLILSATSKGGVGKSYVSINLAEWLDSQNVPFIAFDPDWCNSSLTRFYEKAEFLDISESVQLDNVIRALDRTDLIVVDGVGSLQNKFLDWLEETRVFDLREQLSLDITLVLIIEEDKETVFQAGQAVKRIGSRANWLVVRNLKTSPVTEIYDNSNARKDLLAVGAREISLERLPWNLSSLSQKTSQSIGRLADDESVFFLERQRMRSHQQKIFDEFAKVRNILLPGSILNAPAAVPNSQASPPPPVRVRVPPQDV